MKNYQRNIDIEMLLLALESLGSKRANILKTIIQLCNRTYEGCNQISIKELAQRCNCATQIIQTTIKTLVKANIIAKPPKASMIMLNPKFLKQPRMNNQDKQHCEEMYKMLRGEIDNNNN